MPRGDRTGPAGMGPMTGRGAGYCAGFEKPVSPSGCGCGRGRGFRRMFYATGVPGWARCGYADGNEAADEKSFLANQAGFLEKQLEQVKKRLSQFEEDAE